MPGFYRTVVGEQPVQQPIMRTLPPQQEHARIVDDGYEHGDSAYVCSPARVVEGALPATPSADNSQRKWAWEHQQVQLAKTESEKAVHGGRHAISV